jgi:hypothetical protein
VTALTARADPVLELRYSGGVVTGVTEPAGI